MYYAVSARLISDTIADLHRKLTDGTIEAQKPDGQEIVAAMHRAVINDEGVVRWSEVCYCPTPLEHERRTVYDDHFTDLGAEEVDGYVDFAGEPFMKFLERGAR